MIGAFSYLISSIFSNKNDPFALIGIVYWPILSNFNSSTIFLDNFCSSTQPMLPPNFALSDVLYIFAVLLNPISLILWLIFFNFFSKLRLFSLSNKISDSKYTFCFSALFNSFNFFFNFFLSIFICVLYLSYISWFHIISIWIFFLR